jgi:hypothetical protein
MGVSNRERHAVYQQARAARLDVPVAAYASFAYKWWLEQHPTATALERAEKVTALIAAGRHAVVPITTETTWSKGPLWVGRDGPFPARPDGWEAACRLVTPWVGVR